MPRNLFQSVLLASGVCAAVSTLAASTVQALPRKPVAQEVFPAVESERSVSVSAPAKKKQIPGTNLPKLPDSALAYDLVPSDQIDPLSKRLQLVDTLIRRFARAYDYRTHTVAELETILARMESTASTGSAKTSDKTPLKTPPTPSEKDEISGSDAPRTEE